MSGAQEPNAGSVIAIMQPWDQRPESQSTLNVIDAAAAGANAIPAANIVSFNPPAIPGISTTGGINFVLEGAQRPDLPGPRASLARRDLRRQPELDLSSVFTSFSANVPQLRVDIDTRQGGAARRHAARDLPTMQANLGGQYVN